MCVTRLHVHRIEGLARRHEQAIALGPTEAEIGADLWQMHLAYTGAIGREDMYAVIAGAHPAHAGPDVAVILAQERGAIGDNFTEVLRSCRFMTTSHLNSQ
jgi:hypothetical protein